MQHVLLVKQDIKDHYKLHNVDVLQDILMIIYKSIVNLVLINVLHVKITLTHAYNVL